MIIALSLLIALAGLLMYALATNGKLVAIGFAMFQIGLLAFLLVGVEPLIKLIGPK